MRERIWAVECRRAAALHFDLWVPNFGIQEYMQHTDETDAVFPA